MIVVISDLHLQHTAQDVVRRRDGERVVECGVKRNVSAAALTLLFAEIAENVERSGASQVELVLAGDIFELHRSPAWFFGGSSLRPFVRPEAEPSELGTKVRNILDAVAAENRQFFATLRRCITTGRYSHHSDPRTIAAPIRVHFIPGNHDRLANAWPELRARVRELLCIGGDPSAPFPHLLDWSAEYGVKVRHGHEYEPSNFGGVFEPGREPAAEGYAAPALGDYVTIDMVTRLSVAFRAHYARELRRPGAAGDVYRHLYLALTEFDDVRPSSALPAYLQDAVGEMGAPGFAILRPILREAFETARKDPFFGEQSKRFGLDKYFQGPFAELFNQAIKNLGPAELPKLLAAMGKEPDVAASPAELAARDPGVGNGQVEVVIAGHTHKPNQVALPGPDGRVGCFIDSGTWRTRIDEGVGGAFGRLRSYTMVFCYRQAERVGDEHRLFETWTGHLASDDYGVYWAKDATPPSRATAIAIEFTKLAVHQIDEGDTLDGAELALHFGVDDKGVSLLREQLHNGDVIALDPAEFRVVADPALDGELWCWGAERDLGNSALDRDDPLPWAVDFLPREGDRCEFIGGTTGELLIANARGTRLVLSYRVR